MVKRWDYHKSTRYSESFMEEHPYGLYVQYPDVEKLEQRNAELVTEMEALLAWFDDLKGHEVDPVDLAAAQLRLTDLISKNKEATP